MLKSFFNFFFEFEFEESHRLFWASIKFDNQSLQNNSFWTSSMQRLLKVSNLHRKFSNVQKRKFRRGFKSRFLMERVYAENDEFSLAEFKIDDSTLLKETVASVDNNFAKEISLIDQNMVGNMTCLHARKLAKTRMLGEETKEMNEAKQSVQIYKQELTRKDLDYYSAYLDISLNSMHKKFYSKAIKLYIQNFSRDISLLDPTDSSLEAIGINAHKIISQLTFEREYELIHQFWTASIMFFKPEPSDLYTYLYGILKTDNPKILNEVKAFLANFAQKFDIKPYLDYIADLYNPDQAIIQLVMEVFPYFEINEEDFSNLKKSIIKASKAKFSSDYLAHRSSILNSINTQIHMECGSYVSLETLNQKSSVNRALSISNDIDEMYYDWVAQLTEIIHAKISELSLDSNMSLYEKIENSGPKSILPYLTLFTPEKYAKIIAKEALHTFADFTADSQELSRKLMFGFSDAIYNYYTSKKINSKMDRNCFVESYGLYLDWCKLQEYEPIKEDKTPCMNNILESNNILSQMTCGVKWPMYIRMKLGEFFIDAIAKNLTFKQSRNSYAPVCSRIFLQENKPSLILDKSIRKKFEFANKKLINTRLYPMIIPPLPWLNKDSGCFLIQREPFIRQHLPKNFRKKYENTQNRISKIIEACNTLASTAWTVNREVLKVAENVYNHGGHKGNLEVPSNYDRIFPRASKFFTSFASRKSYDEYYWTKKASEQEFSIKCDFMNKFVIARSLIDKVFWQPHNVDFRSRVYTLSPYLTHYSSDFGRGLLKFYKKKPLKPIGLKWTKVDLVNKLEHLKFENAETKLKYFDAVLLEKIKPTAENPYLNDWWMNTENPWQVLASIISLNECLNCEIPECYQSDIPVHQDGSCNGLQHYAALMRDVSGGISVNLYPSSKKCDVYSDVTEIVKKKNQAIAKHTGDNIAKLIGKYIDRKTIKQSVMTTVYGVTLIGAKDQIKRQLEAKGFDAKYILKASIYLAKLTMDSITDLFPAGTKLKLWLKDSCKSVVKYTDQSLSWVTPLGFIGMQPYFSGSKNENADLMKNINAFPPNFIHSLDAAHMMLTAMECEKKNMEFVSVHDCFWTHACNVPEMSIILREEFIKLHKQPLLRTLHNEFESALGNNRKYKIQALPRRGSLDIDRVRESEFFFC